MKATITNYGEGRKYKHINLLIADERLKDWELNHIWNYGVDCKKDGGVITILLRKRI